MMGYPISSSVQHSPNPVALACPRGASRNPTRLRRAPRPIRRAPPDIRGSGKERGHGTELSHCPKCGKGLKPGKHHVGCSGGKAGARQSKRSRLVSS
jgi:hypothetical protein